MHTDRTATKCDEASIFLGQLSIQVSFHYKSDEPMFVRFPNHPLLTNLGLCMIWPILTHLH